MLLPSQPNAKTNLVPQGTKAVHSIKLSLIKFIVLKLNRAIVWEKSNFTTTLLFIWQIKIKLKLSNKITNEVVKPICLNFSFLGRYAPQRPIIKNNGIKNNSITTLSKYT